MWSEGTHDEDMHQYGMQQRSGFGLLETIAAIGVITTGLFAVFTLVFSNMRVADAASIRFGAVAAAREGIEVVRMLRDENWIAGRPWNHGIAGGTLASTAMVEFQPTSGRWELEYGPFTFNDPETRLVRDETPVGTFWVQGSVSGDGATPYRRIVATYPICSVAPVSPGDADRTTLEVDGARCPADTQVGILVRSTVQWTHAGETRTITAEEELYDWR